MTAAIAASTAVDLSRLPPPDVIETIDYEVLFAEMLAKLVELHPPFSALVESDPAMKILEVAAYFRMIDRQRVNDAARAVMVAYARGGDLDHVAAVFGVTRLEITPADPLTGAAAVMEDDDALRRRILLAPDAYSVAGPALAYVFHALSAHGEILDASATSPAPCEVVVALLGRNGNGTVSAPALAAVTARLSADTVRPLTDQVTVQQAALLNFNVVAVLYLYAGPDAQLIVDTALAALTKKLADLRKVGRDVPRSALIAALHVAGVQRVELVEPALDVIVTAIQAGHVVNIAVTTQVTGE